MQPVHSSNVLHGAGRRPVPLNERQQKVLDALAENPVLSYRELSAMLGVSKSPAGVLVNALIRDGYLRRNGRALEAIGDHTRPAS